MTDLHRSRGPPPWPRPAPHRTLLPELNQLTPVPPGRHTKTKTMTNRYPTSKEFKGEIWPALKVKIQELKAGFQTELADHLCYLHRVGETLYEIISNPREYGDDALLHLQDELKIPESAIGNYVRVYKTFEKEQLKELAERSVETGIALSFKHLTELSHIANKAKRKQLIERIFDESLSANQVHDEVCRLVAPRRKPGGGRKPQRPTSPMAGFVQMTKANKAINNKFCNGWLEIMLESLEASPDNFDERSQQQAMACREHWVRTHEISRDMIAKFDLLEDRFGRINRHRAEQQGLGDKDEDPIEEAGPDSGVGADDGDFDDESVESDPEQESDIETDDDPFDFHDDDEFGTEAA